MWRRFGRVGLCLISIISLGSGRLFPGRQASAPKVSALGKKQVASPPPLQPPGTRLFANLRRPVNDIVDDDEDDDDYGTAALVYRKVREAVLGLATGVTIGVLINEIVVDTENPTRQAFFTAIGFAALQVPWFEAKGNIWRGLGMTSGAVVGMFKLFGVGLPAGSIPGAAFLVQFVMQSGKSFISVLKQSPSLLKSVVEMMSRVKLPHITVPKIEIPRLPKLPIASSGAVAVAAPARVDVLPTRKEPIQPSPPKEVPSVTAPKKEEAVKKQETAPTVQTGAAPSEKVVPRQPPRRMEDIEDMRDVWNIQPMDHVPSDPKSRAAAIIRQSYSEGIIDIRDYTSRDRRRESAKKD